MRITFVLPTADWSGGVKVVATYAAKLKEKGHEVLVLSLPRPPQRLKSRVKNLLKTGVWEKQIDHPPSHMDLVSVSHKVIESARPVNDKDLPDADIVVATWWETAEWVAKLSSKKGRKVFFIQHHEIFPYLPVDRVRATWKLPLKKIVISKWLRDLALTEYGDSSAALIPNSVDFSQFHAPVRGKQAVPTVGMLYSNISWKGCAISLEAVERARQHHPGLKLLAFGTVPSAQVEGLPDYCEYIESPRQDAIREIYSRCDVWVCGSHSEGYHLPPMEAMACRCPVVSTKVGGPIDLISSGVNGFLVDCGDVGALSDGLLRVLTLSDNDWRDLSEKAYQTVSKYSWDDATNSLEREFLNLLA